MEVLCLLVCAWLRLSISNCDFNCLPGALFSSAKPCQFPARWVSLATEVGFLFFFKRRHRDLGSKHQNEGRRIKTGMNLWGFYCCFFGGKEHYFHMRVILSCQININADFVCHSPLEIPSLPSQILQFLCGLN